MKHKLITFVLLLIGTMLMLSGCSRENPHSKVLRMGCFPNVTHVQGLVARNMWRHKSCDGKGWFEREVPGYTEEWYTFNAGPTAMEALFGNTVDVSYVGPSPALNAYAVSAGREVRLLAGAVNGGGCAAGKQKFRHSDERGFPRPQHCDPAAGQYPRCKLPRMADGHRDELPGGRRGRLPRFTHTECHAAAADDAGRH